MSTHVPARRVTALPKTHDNGVDSIVAGRFGTFVLASTTPWTQPYGELVGVIVEALEEDPRVVEVSPPERLDEAWCAARVAFPAPAHPEYLITGADALHTLRLSSWIRFSVEVPAKNQRRMMEEDELPTKYDVLWDGVVALVVWTAPADKALPMSGGHVVVDLLRDALARRGLVLYVQACSPNCHNDFAHTTLRLSAGASDAADVEYRPSGWWGEVDAAVPAEIEDPVAFVFSDLRIPAEEFAWLKNLGRRILEVESDTRQTLGQLVGTDYQRAQLLRAPLRMRMMQRWQMHGWHRESRARIARIWLALTNIETLRRQWDGQLFEFETRAAERGLVQLFEQDYTDEVDRVRSLDLDLMRSGVEEAATRLDNGALMRVTAVAAVAGAVAGGAVGLLAG